MIVNSVIGCKFNNQYTTSVNNHNKTSISSYLYQQKPDIFFGSSAPSTAQLRRMVKQITEKYDKNRVFNNIYEFVSDNVENNSQVEFFRKIMKANLDEKHPIIKKMKLNNVFEFQDVFRSIKTEEDLDVKNYIFDFLLKHPEYVEQIPGCHRSHILELPHEKCQKEFVQYFDENYDVLKTNDEFPRYFDFLLINANSPEKVNLYKNFTNFVIARYKEKSFKTLKLGTYLHAINNEHNSTYVKNMLPITSEIDRYTFLDWYLVNGIDTEEASKTLQELFKTTKKNNIKLNLSGRDLIFVVNSDKNLSVEGILEIDKKYGISNCNPYCAPPGYDEYFWKKYTAIHSLAKTNDLNEHSRALLNYIMENVPRYDYEKYHDLLSESVLKSINTPEKLKDAIEIINAYIMEPELKNAVYWGFDKMFSRYNMSPDEIIAMKRRYMPESMNFEKYNQLYKEFRELEAKYQKNI